MIMSMYTHHIHHEMEKSIARACIQSHQMTADTMLPKLLGPKIAGAPQILFLCSLLASVLQQYHIFSPCLLT